MSFKKERKMEDELLSLTVIAVLSLGPLIAVNLLYSDWAGMFDTWVHWGAIVGIGGIVAVLCFAVVMFTKWKDPVYDRYRHLFWVGCLVAIIYICGFKAAKNETIESPTKQEQAR